MATVSSLESDNYVLCAAMKSSTNEPVEVRGQLEFHLKGRDSRAGPLQTVALKATVGEAKLFIPKALEVGSNIDFFFFFFFWL